MGHPKAHSTVLSSPTVQYTKMSPFINVTPCVYVIFWVSAVLYFASLNAHSDQGKEE